MERGAEARGGGCISFGCHSNHASGCNSIYAWLSGPADSSNASGWNRLYSRIFGGASCCSISNASCCNSSIASG